MPPILFHSVPMYFNVISQRFQSHLRVCWLAQSANQQHRLLVYNLRHTTMQVDRQNRSIRTIVSLLGNEVTDRGVISTAQWSRPNNFYKNATLLNHEGSLSSFISYEVVPMTCPSVTINVEKEGKIPCEILLFSLLMLFRTCNELALQSRCIRQSVYSFSKVVKHATPITVVRWRDNCFRLKQKLSRAIMKIIQIKENKE